MLKTVQTHRQAVRFRRWNRAGYASFRSVGVQVEIGHLSARIADVSLRKQPNGLTTTIPQRKTAMKADCQADDAGAPPDISGTVPTVAVKVNQDDYPRRHDERKAILDIAVGVSSLCARAIARGAGSQSDFHEINPFHRADSTEIQSAGRLVTPINRQKP